jgi:hemoglobin
MSQSLFEKLGGEARVRAIIDVFIDRVFEDRMIGFFFRNADRARIKEMEYQLAASFLGADVKYTGKALGKAHVNHPIRHTDSLRPLITPEPGSGCDPLAARARVKRG